VLPVLNEATALPWVLSRMPPGYRPIVVDNGSTDGSATVAAGSGAAVVHEPRPGFGSACHAGLVSATADVVCFMDADGSLDPIDLPCIAEPVLAGAADLAIGSRRPLRGAWPLHARLANRILALEYRRMTGLRVADLGPMRAARREALLDLELRDRRFGWPIEMALMAARRGWPITFLDVVYHPRAGGRSKVTGTLLGTLRAIADTRAVLRDVDRRVDAEARGGGGSP
jgi:glycosyltransferase involved in cell wall biosynthesis